VPATTEEIDKVLDHTLKCAHRYTVVLEESAAPLFGNYPRKLLADALVNVRQHEICLKTLLHDIINCAKNVEGLQLQLAQRGRARPHLRPLQRPLQPGALRHGKLPQRQKKLAFKLSQKGQEK